MEVTEEIGQRIGKIAFTVDASKDRDDAQASHVSRQRRIQALRAWMLAQWRQEHGEGAN